MKRIGLVSEIFPPRHGGSGRWFSEIYRRFPQGSVVAIVGEHDASDIHDRSFPHRIHRVGLFSREWGLRSVVGLKYYFRIWRHLRGLVRQEGIDEIHCGRILPEGLAALLVRLSQGVPYVCYVHGEDVEGASTSRELTLLTRLVIRYASRIICNSQNTLRILQENWNATEAQLTVMTPGVDIEHFKPDAASKRPENWANSPVVLTVGRLQKRKGHDVMIQALPQIHRSFPDLLYVIVGGGEELDFLRGLSKKLGVEQQVQFVGEISDDEMVNYYRHCDLFALPNRRVGNDDEGFGMVLLEAQACGTAVLAGDSGGTRETMEPGVSGVLVDCTQPEPLALAVCELMGDPDRRAAMGQAGRQRMEQLFAWKSLARSAEVIFDIRE